MNRALAAIAALVVVLILGGLYVSGTLEKLADPDTIRTSIAEAGVWGPVLFIGLAMSLFPFFMLAPPVWVSVSIWPAPEAFAYSYFASMLASLLTYGLAIAVGAEKAAARLPDTMRSWEAKVQKQPYTTLLTLRFMLWANPLVDIFSAVMNVGNFAYLVSTAVGIAIATAFQIAIGMGGAVVLSWAPWWFWVGLVLVSGLGWWWWRWRRHR